MPAGSGRPEDARGEPQRQQQRDRYRDRDDHDDRPGTGIAGTEDPAGHQHEIRPQEGSGRTGRGGHRVHRHDLLSGHHIRQRGRQARRDEPAESVDDQRQTQHQHVPDTGRQRRGDTDHQHQSGGIGHDEN